MPLAAATAWNVRIAVVSLAACFLGWPWAVYGQLADLRKVWQGTDANGIVHTRYDQYIQNIPIYGSQLIAHAAAASRSPSLPFLRWTGKRWETGAIASQRVARSASVPEKHWAHDVRLQRTLRAVQHRWVEQEGPLKWVRARIRPAWYAFPGTKALHPVYVGDALAQREDGIFLRPQCIVDARTGRMIREWNGLATWEPTWGSGPGGNVRTGYYEYGVDRPALPIEMENGRCRLQNEWVRTIDLQAGMGLLAGEERAKEFPCFRHVESGYYNGAVSPANDAHAGISTAVRMLRDWYDVLDIFPHFPLDVRVHYLWRYPNAFWDGVTITVGDGDGQMHPYAVLEVLAHELGHAVTEYTSQLVYSEEPGGLNEAFSDMMGIATLDYAGQQIDWLIGSTVFKRPPFFLRSVSHPSADGKSIEHVSGMYPGMNPHFSSGVYNRVFYSLSGKPGWNVRRAFGLFLDANRYYWASHTDFAAAATGVLWAAADRGFPLEDIVQVFSEVGIACVPDRQLCTTETQVTAGAL